MEHFDSRVVKVSKEGRKFKIVVFLGGTLFERGGRRSRKFTSFHITTPRTRDITEKPRERGGGFGVLAEIEENNATVGLLRATPGLIADYRSNITVGAPVRNQGKPKIKNFQKWAKMQNRKVGVGDTLFEL